MLVLLSFGLVLLATILLVVGLLNDDGIQLIYFSIAASATAAVVLYLAFRRARPQDDVRTDAPEPLPDDLEPRADDSTVVIPAAAAPAAPTPAAPAPAVPPAAAVSEPEPEPEPAMAADRADDAWADDADWEVDDLQFPIADYDELSVAEIMPLLPQLYSDELDIVYEREQTGKNRATILARLEKLKETGTEADAEEAEAASDDATEVVEAPAPPPVRAPMPAPPTVSLLDDEDEDAGVFFPIADYDDLSVSQIVPLLPQLELDELEDVKAREQAGANRTTLIAEIDRYLSGELEAFSWSETDDEPAAAVPATPPAAPAPVSGAGGDSAPIAGYDSMTVADIRPRLSDLSAAELEQLLDYETARDNRKTIVADITRRLEGGDDEPAAPPARKATKRAAKASKRATKAAKVAKSTKKASKKATKAAKKKAAPRFPIANYDELTVADIRPRLTKLSEAQLELVRERELTGAGRKTILNDIDSRLS